jgi:creatinine amidohydrolase
MKKATNMTSHLRPNTPVARRGFLSRIAQGAAAVAAGLAAFAPKKALATALPAADRASETNGPQTGSTSLPNQLSTTVQMQFMRPGQLEAAARRFPVVYVPFGLIEWHGRHLPLGNDALKAHAILVKCAEQVGGVVYPPVYFHDGFDQTHLVPVLTDLFQRLKKTGFRVIMGVSGHNVKGQIAMIEAALKPVLADGSVMGVGLWEITLSQGPESNTDHAAKWETSNMMFVYPDLVDLSALGTGPLAPNMKAPDGIGGQDPRQHASAKMGQRNIERAAEAIGRKARALLNSLPPNQREFRLKGVSPEHWWMV